MGCGVWRLRVGRRVSGRLLASVGVVVLAAGSLVAVGVSPAGATNVTTEAEFKTAWQLGTTTFIDLLNDITITCASGEPTRSSATAIVVNGNGHVLTQACANKRVLEQMLAGKVTLTSITVTGGTTGAGLGGAALHTQGDVLVQHATLTGNHSGGEGGAINTVAPGMGTVTVEDSAITDNTAGGSGGAIAAQGRVTITNSTLSGNTTVGSGGAIRAYDGATIVNSTLSNNTASGGGGAISVENFLDLIFATVVDNSGAISDNLDFSAGTLFASFGSVVALRSPPVGSNCLFEVDPGIHSSFGYNVDDDGSCDFGAGPGDRSNFLTALGLGALANNGGPTQTRLPQTGSPLIDSIPNAACQTVAIITTDQRGLARPSPPGGACDVGAVEVQRGGAGGGGNGSSTTPSSAGGAAVAATPILVVPKFTG